MEPTVKIIQRLKGAAPVQNNPQEIGITGAIDSARIYLAKIGAENLASYDPKHCLICVTDNSITFKGNLDKTFGVTVQGLLSQNKLIKDIGINADKMYLPKDLEKKLRFMGPYFNSPEDYKYVIGSLKQVSIKTKGILESEAGPNKTKALAQREHDFKPIEFTMKLPLFEGMPDSIATFPVSIYADVTDAGARLWLECVELPTIIEARSREIINEELAYLHKTPFPVIFS